MTRLSKALSLGLLVALLGSAASMLPLGMALEESVGLPILFNLRGDVEAPADILVVSMDKESSERLGLEGEPEKWPRALHAELIENLSEKGAVVISFDILFNKTRSPEEDRAFSEAIHKAGNVVLCQCLKRDIVPVTMGEFSANLNIETAEPPIPSLAGAAAALAPFPLPKIPARVSQFWTFKTGAGDTPTMPVAAFQIFTLDEYGAFVDLMKSTGVPEAYGLPGVREGILRDGGIEDLVRSLHSIFVRRPYLVRALLRDLRESPVEGSTGTILESMVRLYGGGDSAFLNFYGPPGTVTTIPYYRMLPGYEDDKTAIGGVDVRGKAVFVGLSEKFRPEKKDGFYTIYPTRTEEMSGIEIMATAFANILDNRLLKTLPVGYHLMLVAFCGFLFGALCFLLPPAASGLILILAGLAYLLTARFLFASGGVWMPLVVPLMIQPPLALGNGLLWKYLETNRERRNIRKAIGYHLPGKVVDRLARNLVDVRNSSEEVYGTCLVTDVEKYTKLSGTMSPSELRDLMNDYFEAIFEPIKEHGGFPIQVKGDSMLALWTAAGPDPTVRSKACRAAVEVREAAERFNLSARGVSHLTRLGMHSGYLVLGHVGAGDYYEYIPTGDTVNAATRIEGLNKKLGTRMLVSGEVLRQVNGFLTRDVGRFLLANMARPISIHEMVSLPGKYNRGEEELCRVFEMALDAYRRQSWEEAIDLFNNSSRLRPEDGPSLFYLDLCRRYRATPPEEDWTGMVAMAEK